MSSFVGSSPCLFPPPNFLRRKSVSCHKPTLRDKCPAGLYGSTKNVFGVLVAPNAPGCSTPLARPLAILLMIMMRNFELQRDREFSSHVCADHPSPPIPPR